MKLARPTWVKLGGKGRSATRLVVPNEQTLAGVGGRFLQCQFETHALQQMSSSPPSACSRR
jgi:hypothetical protein